MPVVGLNLNEPIAERDIDPLTGWKRTTMSSDSQNPPPRMTMRAPPDSGPNGGADLIHDTRNEDEHVVSHHRKALTCFPSSVLTCRGRSSCSLPSWPSRPCPPQPQVKGLLSRSRRNSCEPRRTIDLKLSFAVRPERHQRRVVHGLHVPKAELAVRVETHPKTSPSLVRASVSTSRSSRPQTVHPCAGTCSARTWAPAASSPAVSPAGPSDPRPTTTPRPRA